MAVNLAVCEWALWDGGMQLADGFRQGQSHVSINGAIAKYADMGRISCLVQQRESKRGLLNLAYGVPDVQNGKRSIPADTKSLSGKGLSYAEHLNLPV